MICSISSSKFMIYLRWCVLFTFPFVFIASYLITHNTDAGSALVASMLACYWLLYRMHHLNKDIIAIWIVIAVFLSFYFLRYPVLLSQNVMLGGYFPSTIGDSVFTDVVILTEALNISSLTFVVFCIVAGVLIPSREKKGDFSSYHSLTNKSDRVVRMLLIFVPSLIIGLGYLAYFYRIGQMGFSSTEPLPFRMRGIIFYARQVVIPLLILSIIYYYNRLGDFRLMTAGIILLAIHGISDTILRATKSSLILCLILFAFLSISGGIRIARKGIITIAILMCGAILLFPIIIVYRANRFDLDVGLWQAFMGALSHQSLNLWSLLKASIMNFYFRMPGIETVWVIKSMGKQPLGGGLIEILRSQYGVTGYLNFEIYQNPDASHTLFAPGFVGWLYLAWGWKGAVLGGSLLAFFCVWVPRWLDNMKLFWLPVTRTFFLWILLISLIDGTLDGNLFLIIVGCFTLLAIEIASIYNV